MDWKQDTLSRVSNCSVPHNILTETNSDVLQQSLELAMQPEWCNLAVTVMRVQNPIRE